MANTGSDPRGGVRVDVMRSQLGRVRGLGAAKSHVNVWWAERTTSIALLPLTLWFVFSALRLIGAPRVEVAVWASRPWNAVLLIALVLASFYHMALGLQVVIEDYVHAEGPKSLSLLAVKAVTWLFGLACLISVLKLAL